MKSTMKRSLAALLTLIMLFSMLAVSIQSVVAAAPALDNDPCSCDKEIYVPETEVVAPTCVEYGGTWNTCPNCGDVWVTDFEDPTGIHTWSAPVDPTCTQPGNTGGACTECGTPNPTGTTIPAYNHVYPADWEVESLRGESAYYMIANNEGDCTTDGVKTLKCALCNHVKDENITAPGHDHVLNELDYKAPNCTEDGYTRYACSVCLLKVEVPYDKLGHNLDWNAKDPTCFKPGYLAAGSVAGKANDGYCTNPVLDKAGHPTGEICGCTDEAYYLAPLNHKDKVDVPTTWVLTDAEGAKWVDLNKNGTIDTTDELLAVADICKLGEELAGHKYYYCPVCDADPEATTPFIKVTDEVDHSWPDAPNRVITPASCTTPGIGEYVCADCGHKEEREIPTTPHQYTTDGAATSAIVYTFKLPNGEWYKVDGAIYWSSVNTIPAGATGAVAVDWVAQKVASCGVKGIFTHACAVCDHVESLVVESKHVNPVWQQDVAANCVEAAHAIYQCSNPACVSDANGDGNTGDYKVYVEGGLPLGHLNKENKRIPLDANGKPVAVVIVEGNDPTCTQPGTETVYGCYDSTCPLYANINATVAPSAPALSHDFTNKTVVTVNPNCAHRGFKVEACGRCEEYVEDSLGVAIPLNEAWEYRIGKGTASDSAFGTILTSDTDHTWNTETPYTAGYAATCKDNGRQNVYECTTCHKLKGGDYIAPLPENRATTKVDPTCLNNGYFVNYCQNCYDIDDFDAAAYAANPSAYVFTGAFHAVTVTLDTNAIANNGGHAIKGAVYQADGRVDITNAVTATSSNVKNAGTCASEPIDLHNGYYTCKHCEQEIEFWVHLKHTPISAPTCGQASICADCGETIAKKLGHLYDDPSDDVVDTKGIVHTPATCSANGYDTYNCYRCDAADGDYVAELKADSTPLYPRLAHSYNITAATCTTDKYCTRTCCKNPTTGASVPGIQDKDGSLSFYAKLDHLYDNPDTAAADTEGIVVTAPTCTAKGYTTKTCYRCNDVTVDTPTDKIPHVADTTLFDERAATCLTFGFKNYVCKMCKSHYDFATNEFFPATGHTIVEVGATCTTVAYEYCSTCNWDATANAVKTTIQGVADWKGDYNYKVTGEALKHILYGEDGVEGGDDDVKFENICSDLEELVDENGEVTCDRCTTTLKYDESHVQSAPQDTATCHADGYSYWYCTVDGCNAKKITGFAPKKDHNFVEDPTHADWKTATLEEEGLKVEICTNCGKTPVCSECIKKTPYTIQGIFVTAKAENMYGKDYHVVNNGIIAYTISIKALASEFYSLKVDVKYDRDQLTYIGYNLGDDHINIFGARVNTIGTDVRAAANATPDANGLCTLGFYGFNENPGSEEKTDVKLTNEQEFVTVYFRVNADVRSDAYTDNVAVDCDIKLGDVTVLTASNARYEAAQIDKTDADTVEIHKLGDATDDAVLASEDIAAIKSLVLKGGVGEYYDARLDIDVDGAITADDLMYLAQKYVYTYSYEDICDFKVAFDPAKADEEFKPSELA